MVKRQSHIPCILPRSVSLCWLQAAASQPVAVAAGGLQESYRRGEKVSMGSVPVIPASRCPGEQKAGSAPLTLLKTPAKAPLLPHTAQALASVFPSQKQLGQGGCASQAWQKSQIRSKRKDTHLPECLQCRDRAAGRAGAGGALPGPGVTARWLPAALQTNKDEPEGPASPEQRGGQWQERSLALTK